MKLTNYLKVFYRWIFRGETSYSQLGEDLIAKFFLSNLKTGSYVDIGANDPIYLNNTYKFYRQGWQGLCIEPNSQLCSFIRRLRPRDTVLNIGLGAKEADMEFYMADPDTLSTFSAAEADRISALGHKIVGTKRVPVRTLASVLKDFGRAVDLLTIDTEGMDLEILASNDWAKFRPKLIIAETAEYHGDKAVRSNNPYDQLLLGHGYLKIADTYINGIYVEKEFAASRRLERGII